MNDENWWEEVMANEIMGAMDIVTFWPKHEFINDFKSLVPFYTRVTNQYPQVIAHMKQHKSYLDKIKSTVNRN